MLAEEEIVVTKANGFRDERKFELGDADQSSPEYAAKGNTPESIFCQPFAAHPRRRAQESRRELRRVVSAGTLQRHGNYFVHLHENLRHGMFNHAEFGVRLARTGTVGSSDSRGIHVHLPPRERGMKASNEPTDLRLQRSTRSLNRNW